MQTPNRKLRRPPRPGRTQRTKANLGPARSSPSKSAGPPKSTGKHASRAANARQLDGLSAAEIMEVTLKMASGVGFGRLSMRQIAAKLGVTATALYYHVHNKNELLDRVAAHIMDSIETPDRGLPWGVRLRQVVQNQQATMLAYPGLARFLVHNRESGGALRWMEMILSVLDDARFSDRDMTRALAMLTFFINPFTLIDDRPHKGTEHLYRRRRLDARLKEDSSRYPCLTRLRPALDGSPFESYLPVALDGVIAGIAAGLKQSKRPSVPGSGGR